MKLSLALSVLLVSGSLFMSGCDSSSSAQEAIDQVEGNITEVIDEITGDNSEAAAPKFTTEMLAGKTFYTYFRSYENGAFEYSDNMQFNFSANASTLEAISIRDGENYGSALPVALSGSKMTITVGDEEKAEFLFKNIDTGLIMVSGSEFVLWTPSQQADGGQTAYEAFLSAEQENIGTDAQKVAILTANPWYLLGMEWNDGQGNAQCQAKATLQDLDNGTAQYVDNGELQTITIDSTTPDDEKSYLNMLASNGEVLLVQNNDDIQFWFKNREDVEAYITAYDPNNVAQCMAHYPAE
jgi:hypothetical protein